MAWTVEQIKKGTLTLTVESQDDSYYLDPSANWPEGFELINDSKHYRGETDSQEFISGACGDIVDDFINDENGSYFNYDNLDCHYVDEHTDKKSAEDSLMTYDDEKVSKKVSKNGVKYDENVGGIVFRASPGNWVVIYSDFIEKYEYDTKKMIVTDSTNDRDSTLYCLSVDSYQDALKCFWQQDEKDCNMISRDFLSEVMESHLKEYLDWVIGDVYQYYIKDESDSIIDSCVGFIGDSAYAMEEGENQLELCFNQAESMYKNNISIDKKEIISLNKSLKVIEEIKEELADNHNDIVTVFLNKIQESETRLKYHETQLLKFY